MSFRGNCVIMRNFRLYLVAGLMTFSIGVIAGRFFTISHAKENCAENFTMTFMNGKNKESSDVIIKDSNSSFSITLMGVKDNELSKVMPKINGKPLLPCHIINKSSL